MRKNTMIKSVQKIALLLLLPFFFLSCEIGLGAKVDIIAPTLKVLAPENTGFILQTFTINGNAQDDISIHSLEINIEPLDNPTKDNSYKFRILDKKWEKFNASQNKWESYNFSDESHPTYVKGTDKEMEWSLSYTFDNSVPNGTEFVITTQVYDKGSNESKASKDERSVTVDMALPMVSLIYPATNKSYTTAESLASSYSLEDNTVLTNLINGEFEISGSQKEEGKLEKLVIYLDEKTDTSVQNLNENLLYSKELTGDNLRNWSVTVDLSKLPGFAHDKKLVRLVTQSFDQAGNIETVCHGWFTYWNDADIPWVVANFGGNSYNDGERQVVYPNCDLQGQSYDDDGLALISINVYLENETTPLRSQIIDLASENYPKYKAWSVKSHNNSSNFRIEAECTDIKGNKSNKEIRYMEVKDVNPPTVTITTDLSKPMIGNASGDITLSGTVVDDGGIKALKLVRLKADVTDDVMIKYFSSTYSEWIEATTAGAVDSNGNKVWDLTSSLSSITSSDSLIRKSFNKTFNIFSDFGIDGTAGKRLNAQSFIIMAVDDGDSAKIDQFTYAGDITAPELTIDLLKVYKADNSEKESIDFERYNTQKLSKMLTPYNRNSSGTITDKIELSGTWKDNSTDVWSDKTKRGEFKIDWEGATVSLTVNANGTWTTGKITPPDATTAVIAMELYDYAGNVAKANENFFISSNDPELLRITTIENDGSYKAGQTIHIELEFNKAVTFADGSGAPTLTLNVPATGTKAAYSDGNGSTTHVFTYTIATGDDVSALDVTQINTNGNTWKATVNNKEFTVNNMSVSSLTNAKKLKGSKTICIDTKAPVIESIKAISSAGYYSQNKEILIQLAFNEDVSIGDVSKLKLTFNNSSVTTTSAKKTGSSSVLFTYKVGAGQNFNSGLSVTGVTIDGAGIKDVAENQMATVAYPSGKTLASIQTGLSSIIIDTSVPEKPTISGITDGSIVYASGGASFTLGNLETGSTRKYSIDGGASWQDYTGAVQLTNNGDYTVMAYQEDKAGNNSGNTTGIHLVIDKGSILTSITAGVATGTYTTNKVIPIYLNFRKAVTIAAGASLTLDYEKTAVYSSGSGTTRATFNYTVEPGDSSNGLDVTAINGTYTDSEGNNIDSYVKTIPTGKNLINSKTIKIVTALPVVTSMSFNNTTKTLSLTFNNTISKNSGNITITHGTGFKAPAVLSVSEYNNLVSLNSDIADYYTIGLIGSDADGNPDTLEKYILNFDNDITTPELLTALTTANADKVIVPINSSYVTISGKVLSIRLEDSYALPVKGSSYTVSIPANLVSDSQKNKNEENNSVGTFAYNGVEAPVIRIQKNNESITGISNNSATVTQPLTAAVKVECRTPGQTPTVTITSQRNATQEYTKNSGKINRKTLNLTNDNLTKTTTGNKVTFTLGSNTDTTNGYIYKIQATTGSGTNAQTVYEYAYRSVYTLTDAPEMNEDVSANASTYSQLWVRGSNKASGGTEISSFPVSWTTSEFDKVRAMTNSTGSNWYWVTWKINVNAYIQPLRGNMPADAVTKGGPGRWCWGMQGPIPTGLENYILYPGHSLSISGNTDYIYGQMSFYKKHCEYRNGDAVIKEMQPAQ